MRVLITGAAGFVGSHLVRHLRAHAPELELHGTALTEGMLDDVPLHGLDLRDQSALTELIRELQPQQIYHLAAWALVRQSFANPWETIENNVRVQLNVILACLEAKISPRMLVVTSGEIYGGEHASEPTSEDAPLRPSNPYSVSKVTQDMLALQYFISHDLPIVRARPFNHLGRGQAPGFVAPDFAQQIARIEAGQQPPVIEVGDLTAERDFTDVRDIVRAYHLLMEHGQAGEAYNVCSGRTYRISDMLTMLLECSDCEIRVQPKADLMHKAIAHKTWGDPSKIHAATGWEPRFPLKETLREVLQDWRERIQAEAR